MCSRVRSHRLAPLHPSPVCLNFCATCDVDSQSVVEQFQLADETLFERVLNDDRHVLHSLLPPSTEYSYNLRRRRHDYELIAKTRTLNTNNFIIRLLYKDSY